MCVMFAVDADVGAMARINRRFRETLRRQIIPRKMKPSWIVPRPNGDDSAEIFAGSEAGWDGSIPWLVQCIGQRVAQSSIQSRFCFSRGKARRICFARQHRSRIIQARQPPKASCACYPTNMPRLVEVWLYNCMEKQEIKCNAEERFFGQS